MALKGTSILSSLKLKPMMNINIKYPTLDQIKNEKIIPKSF
jgi:hypothetical protein